MGASTSTARAFSSTGWPPRRPRAASSSAMSPRSCPARAIRPTMPRTAARRQTDISVITANSFEVRLRTRPVRLLDSDALRDVWADGDQALLKLDAGRDVNGNGKVDFTDPGRHGLRLRALPHRRAARSSAPAASAPREATESSARLVDASKLEEGIHFITVRAWRHRTDGGPAVFSDFKRVIYVDRLPPRQPGRLRPSGGGRRRRRRSLDRRHGRKRASRSSTCRPPPASRRSWRASARARAGSTGSTATCSAPTSPISPAALTCSRSSPSSPPARVTYKERR